MERVLYTTLSENIQDETKEQSFKPEGIKELESMLSSVEISQVETKNLGLNAKEETNERMNGQVDMDSESPGVCEHANGSESLVQKAYSPTLIESAFKVMKNLFSPDKTKSKSANIISPVKQHQSASGSPSSSIYIARKTEFATSESGIESPLTIQTGESSIKNQLNMNQVGVLYSPLTLESHNNTDESFLTTVSIIDDSFHSAITNLDENGESMKLETNIMGDVLNNSQNLDVGDPYNETLENSEYYLENTTLRNGSFALEGTKVADVSVLSKDGSGEYWSSSQVNGIQNGNVLVDPTKNPVHETQGEVTKEDHCDRIIQKKDITTECDETLKKGHCEDENAPIMRPEESSDTTAHAKIYQGSSTPVKNMNMEDIFLNKAFDTPKNNSHSLEILSKQNNACENDSEALEGEKQKAEVNCCYKLKHENGFEVSNDDRDVSLENSISTTTVVLNSVDSVDLDQVLMSLEDVSNPDADSPQISSIGSISALSENITEKQFSNEFDNFQDSKPLSKNNPDSEGNSFRVHKPQKNRSSISERDSSGNSSNFNKIKLHKSDELINHRIPAESPEGKRTVCNKKSSLDVSLIKNTEASKQSSPEPNSEHKTEFGTSELNAPVEEDFKNQNLSELNNDVTRNESDATLVISQQSYTVLITDKRLNRPVIESLNVDEDFPEKYTFQTDDLSSACSAETLILESCATSNYCNASLGAAHSVTSSHQKQSTPLRKGNGRDSPTDDCRTPAMPTSLNLTSPKDSVHDGKTEIEHSSTSSKLASSEKTIEMFNSNEDPAEFSPVNPISENELIFSNSVECEIGGNPCCTVPDPKCARTFSSKEPSEPNKGKKSGSKTKRLLEAVSETTGTVGNLNQTFDKKLGSPQPHKMNQTFDKMPKSPASSKSSHLSEDTPGCEKLNATFDKSAGRPSADVSNKTFTKKTESLEIEKSNQTFVVVSESPDCNEMNKTYNKNFVSKGPNQTFDQKDDSPGPQKLNETFAKKSQSTGQTTQRTDPRLDSPIPNITNQTFVKEKEVDSNQQKKVQDMNKTFQGISGSEAVDITRDMEPGMQGDKKEKAPEKQTPPDKGSTEDVPVAQNVDQQDSDYIDGCHRDLNGSFVSGRSSNASFVGSELSTLLLNEGSLSRNQSIDDLAGKLGKLDLNDSSGSKQITCSTRLSKDNSVTGVSTEEKNAFSESVSPLDDKLRCESYLVQLIQEQFSSNDIEKICSVVDDLSSMKLSSQILKASEVFDKSIHENLSNAESKSPEPEIKPDKSVNSLSPKSFDFLNSIQGKPTGRDWSRESLYVKFDPLVQPNPNSLIDFTKEGKALAAAEKSPPITHDSSVCEQLLAISPQKKPDDIVPPLTPLSHKSKASRSEDKMVRVKELQNEIYFLKNLYAERERTNKAKMDDYESQVAKLTAESCFLEDKLKEANDREKSLVKKMKEKTQSLTQLKVIMEEYVKVISKLTTELETLKAENQKQIEALSTEKDSYMTHLQNTEAAFTDVHAKYEKSKKTIVSLKTNEAMYRNTIAEQAQKLEDFKARAREAQEKATKEFEKIQEELGETKASHNQEAARLRAQLRKTELKVEALQESLEQKIKENQQLTAICDELIEGKK